MFYLYHVICFKIEIQLEGFAKPDTPDRNFSEFKFIFTDKKSWTSALLLVGNATTFCEPGKLKLNEPI